MPRTTINIDGPVLKDLKRLQKREGKPLGQLISELLAHALGQTRRPRPSDVRFRWVTRSMRARIDLGDKDSVYAVLDKATTARGRA